MPLETSNKPVVVFTPGALSYFNQLTATLIEEEYFGFLCEENTYLVSYVTNNHFEGQYIR
jgi:hypothetical protein